VLRSPSTHYGHLNVFPRIVYRCHLQQRFHGQLGGLPIIRSDLVRLAA
jgi:hypothetical protein